MKLTIPKRSNLENNKVYLKIKAEKTAMSIISDIAEKFDKNFSIDEIAWHSVEDYSKWKDEILFIKSKNYGADIICGVKSIHLIIWKFPSYKKLNKILDKYLKFASTEKFEVKGFKIKPKNTKQKHIKTPTD
jgi:hypothetical protein